MAEFLNLLDGGLALASGARSPAADIAEILAPYGGEWFRGEAAYTHLSGGNVDAWTGSLLGRIIADAVGIPYAEPVLTATGAQHLQGMAAHLSGAAQATICVVIKSTAAGGNKDIFGVQNGLLSYFSGPAGAVQVSLWAFTGGAYPAAETFGETAPHDESAFVFMAFRVDWAAALGSICKTPKRNDIALTGSVAQQSGDSTPNTCPNKDFILGACAPMGFNSCDLALTDLVVAPAFISDGDLTTLNTKFHLHRVF